MNSQHTSSIKIVILWTLVAMVGRLMPHPDNATPMLSLALFSGYVFERRLGMLSTAVALLASDIVLSLTSRFPMFGSWSVFTYSAYLVIALPLSFSKKPLSAYSSAGFALVASLGFWWWTNLGTWLTTSDMYPHTLHGLLLCFDAGLPFLRQALIGNMLWALVIYKVGVQPLGTLLT